MTQAPQQRDQRGTSTLEFVVVLPTLLLIMLGIVELSRAWLTLNLVTTAAREGARMGVVTPTIQPGDVFDSGPATTRINQVLATAGLAAASVSVICPSPCLPDSQVQADVTVTFQTIVPLLLPVLQSFSIQQSAIMRYE